MIPSWERDEGMRGEQEVEGVGGLQLHLPTWWQAGGLFVFFVLFFLSSFFFDGKQVVWDDLECRHGVERNRDKKDCEANKEWKEKGCNLCRCHPDGKEVVCFNQCTSQGAMHCSEDGNGDEVCRYNEPPPKRRVYRPWKKVFWRRWYFSVTRQDYADKLGLPI